MDSLEKFREIIKNKAKERAHKEVSLLQKTIQKSGILQLDVDFMVVNGKGFHQKIDIAFLTIGHLSSSDELSNPLTILYKQKYAQYLEEETVALIQKMEVLTDQVNELFSLKEDLNNKKFKRK